MTVSVILSRKGRAVETVSPDTSLKEVARVLADKKIGAVVVSDDGGAILGILSERDVVRAVARGGGAALEDQARAHMTKDVVTTSEDKTIVSVMEEMTTRRFRHMPVAQGVRLVGIVSIGDIVNHRLREMESEQAALRDYIHST